MNLDHLPNACGVYLLTHRKTGDTYVGGASGIRVRVNSHLATLRANIHSNAKMMALARDHGIDFDATVLELATAETCREVEHRWIQKIRPTLNHYLTSPKAKPSTTRPWHGKGRIPLNARVNQSLLDEMKALARADRRTLSYMVERAIREYVERHGKPSPSPRKK